MAVYLGTSGSVQLTRDQSKSWMPTTLDAPDVNVSQRRFSVNFFSADNVPGINYDQTKAETEQNDSLLQFITGDRVEIRTMPGADGKRPPLPLIPDWDQNSITRYVYVDQAGGMRLYDKFSDSLEGNISKALELLAPPTPQLVELKTRNSGSPRYLAEVSQFEVTTSRENIDITLLSDNYKRQYEAGVIQGQGRLTCFWKHEFGMCDVDANYRTPELPVYLAQLVLRLDQGADFTGRFFIFDAQGGDEQSVWYQCDTCLVSNVVVSVDAGGVIESTIDFVCSGRVMLRQGIIPDRLLLESDGDFVLDEALGDPVDQQQKAD